MRLNDTQIRRIIQHVCDKNRFSELSGGVTFYFVPGGDFITKVTCDHNGYEYKPVVKISEKLFPTLKQESQIEAVVRATCVAIDEYRVKQLRQKPKKYAVNKYVRECFRKPEPVEN